MSISAPLGCVQFLLFEQAVEPNKRFFKSIQSQSRDCILQIRQVLVKVACWPVVVEWMAVFGGVRTKELI
jgi:hypothetical protein